jgi:hypothetical protein
LLREYQQRVQEKGGDARRMSVDRTEPDAAVEDGRRCPKEVSGVPGITRLLFLPLAQSDNPTRSSLPEE